MFRTDLLSIIRSLNTVFSANGICHTSYVDCLLARLRFHGSKQRISRDTPVKLSAQTDHLHTHIVYIFIYNFTNTVTVGNSLDYIRHILLRI